MIGWNMIECLCECDHPEAVHAEPDFDFNGEGYVPRKRPCSLCDCAEFWQ